MSDDLISRQAAIDELDTAIATLVNLPSAQSDCSESGKWYDVGSLSCRCSRRGCKNNRESRFCPNCGAKMEGEAE